MSDEPGLPADGNSVSRLRRLMSVLDIGSADGRAGAMAIVREIEAAEPGAIAQMNAGLELRRMGCTTKLPG